MQCAVCTVIDGMCTGVLVVAVERCGARGFSIREARACACVTSTANNMIAGNNEHFF